MPGVIKFRTINDLNAQEQQKYFQKYYDENYQIIKKYFGFFERQKVKRGILAILFGKSGEITISKDMLIRSNCSFSETGINIPLGLHLITHMFIKGDLATSGVFRVNSDITKLKDCSKIIKDITNGRKELFKGCDHINSRFDQIDIAETYKNILKDNENPIIPSSLISIIEMIESCQNPQEKIILTRILVFGLPSTNRNILENAIYVCNLINVKYQESTSLEQHMNLDGICVVIMPNLFKFNLKKIKIEQIIFINRFVYYLFKNYKECFSI